MYSTFPSHAARGALELGGTFAGLMDLYERSYIGIRRLVPEVPAVGSRRVSTVAGALDLHLHVLEIFPYTTEIGLTYYFHRNGLWVAEPNLILRVYRDARQAEVLAAHLRHWPAYDGHGDREPGHLRQRLIANRFLVKWLNYCWHQGHRFDASSTVAELPPTGTG